MTMNTELISRKSQHTTGKSHDDRHYWRYR